MAKASILKGLVLAISLCAIGMSPTFAANPDLEKAEALIDEGKAEEAFAILEPFEIQLANNSNFNFILAKAALDIRKPNIAIRALERALASDPHFVAARVGIAAAYFQLGDVARGTAEMETALKDSESDRQ